MIQSVWMNLTGLQKAKSNTNDFYIHYMDKSRGTPPFFRREKGTSKDGNIT